MSVKALALGLLLWDSAHGGPDDEEKCTLTSQTIYPWITRIWHKKQKLTFGHGAILSYLAVLTTCRNFDKDEEDPYVHKLDYEIVGNRVTELKPTQKVCYQSRDVSNYIRHPKCTGDVNTKNLYDLGIFILKEPFNATGATSYPTMPLVNERSILESDYLYLRETPRTSGCEFPLLYYKDKKEMTFDTTWQVENLNMTDCIDKFCEYEPANENMTIVCRYTYGYDGDNVTEICMEPTKPIDQYFEYSHTGRNFYSGGTLVCNGSAMGFITFVKWRSTFRDYRKDFFFVTSFVRAYPWIVENKIRYGANWIKLYFFEREEFSTAKYEPPKTKERKQSNLWPEKKRKAYERILNFVYPFPKGEKTRSALSQGTLNPLAKALGLLSAAVLRLI